MSNLITPEEALRRFENNPEIATAFDAACRRERPECKTRREAIVACINDIATLRTKQAEAKELRAKIAAAKVEIARLEKAKAEIPQLREKVATAKRRLAAKPAPVAATPSRRKWMNPIPTTAAARPEPAPPPKSPITREVFNKLTPAARMAYVKSGGKLSN